MRLILVEFAWNFIQPHFALTQERCLQCRVPCYSPCVAGLAGAVIVFSTGLIDVQAFIDVWSEGWLLLGRRTIEE